MILLDTHALVWWVSDPARIPAKARRLIDSEVKDAVPLVVSSISIWEVAMLVARRRLELTVDADTWLANVEALPFLKFVPVDNRIAAQSVRLDDFPVRDPADRIIVATALGLNVVLVTADKRLRSYRAVRTTWD